MNPRYITAKITLQYNSTIDESQTGKSNRLKNWYEAEPVSPTCVPPSIPNLINYYGQAVFRDTSLLRQRIDTY